MAGDLAGHAADLDARRHVPDPVLTEVLDAFLLPGSAHQVLVLHGPGGIGKSAALRQVARLAEDRGLQVASLDGRDLAESPHTIVERLAAAAAGEPEVLLVDEAGALGASAQAVRTAIGALPAHARVVFADRRPIDRRFLPEGLGVLGRRLRPLPDELCREIVRRYGLEQTELVDSIVTWASGSPLALVMAAMTGDSFATGQAAPEFVDLLARRLGGDLGVDLELLRVASLSWEVHADLLADVLPLRDPEEAMDLLRRQPVVEQLGDRAVLHPLIARAVAERFRLDDPHRHRTLVMRLATHLHDRGARGDMTALPPLADLMRAPLLRQGLGLATSEHYYADRVRTGDANAISAWLPAQERDRWPVLAPWLADDHRHTQIVRDLGGGCASAIAILPATQVADPGDPLVGPLVDFAAAEGLLERCVITAFQLVLPPDLPAELTRYANAISVLGCGLRNPRYDLVNEIGWTDEMRELTAGYGYREIPALRRDVGGRELRTWFADSGEGGLAGMLLGAVAGENGTTAVSLAGENLLEALDAYTDDTALARIAATLGEHDADSVALMRSRVRRAADSALEGRDDLRALVEVRYLTPGADNAETIRRLFLSRSNYFRMLRRARDLFGTRSG